MDAVTSARGQVVVHDFHGKGRGKGEAILSQKKGKAGADEIVIDGPEDALEITIPIVIGFGVSIKGTAEHIINRIFEELEGVFGVTPARVTVINTGTASRDVQPRHMEFYRKSDSDEIAVV